MKRLAFFCLALTGWNIAPAQQLAEWRPNIAEDNKAATWADTSDFLRNSINNESFSNSSLVYGLATTDEECSLAFDSAFFTSNGATLQHFKYKLNLHLVDPISVRVNSPAGSVGGSPYEVVFEGANEVAFAKVKMWTYNNGSKDPRKTYAYRSAQETLALNCDALDQQCHVSDAQIAKLILRFSDQEIAKRFSRAVMHSALLCGGKKAISPF